MKISLLIKKKKTFPLLNVYFDYLLKITRKTSKTYYNNNILTLH
jgi:hypothetical protein